MAAVTIFFALMAGRAMVGLGGARPIGAWWPATGSLLGALRPGSRAWAITGLVICAGVVTLGAGVQLAKEPADYPQIAIAVIVLVGPLVPIPLRALRAR